MSACCPVRTACLWVTATSGLYRLLDHHVDGVNPVRVEGEVVLNLCNGLIRVLIAPDRVDRTVAARWNREVGAITLVRAIGGVRRAFEQRHVHILARHVLDGR